MKHYTSEELYNMEKPKIPEAFSSFPKRWRYSDTYLPFIHIYDHIFDHTDIDPLKLKIVVIEDLEKIFEAAAPALDKKINEIIDNHKIECRKNRRNKLYGYDTMEERLPILRDYFEELYTYLFMKSLKEHVYIISSETLKENKKRALEEWNNKSFIEKQIIKSRNTVKPAWLKEGWFIYIFVLIISIIFHGTIVIWVIATIYFFLWRKKEIDKFN